MCLIFLHGESNRGKIACKITPDARVRPGVPSNAQTSQDLPGVHLVGLGVV